MYHFLYQCNDDTGNRRPIMLCLNDANKEEAAESKPETEEIEDSAPKKMEVDSSPPKPCESDDSKVEKIKAEDKKIRGIGDTYSKVLIK
jgi:predicted flap endonuclease-1-like 5' DNA nuclease